jgi:hypothetical protein
MMARESNARGRKRETRSSSCHLVKTCGCGAEEWRELLMLSAATHCTRSYGGGNITHHLRCAAPALRLPNLRDVVDGSLRVSVRASSLHDRADEHVTECAVAAGRDVSQTHEMKNGMNGGRDGHTTSRVDLVLQLQRALRKQRTRHHQCAHAETDTLHIRPASQLQYVPHRHRGLARPFHSRSTNTHAHAQSM